MTKKKAMDEVAVLLSEVEIGPYKIKPWSFGKFKKAFPALMEIIPVLKGLGLTLENIKGPEDVKNILLNRGLEIIGGFLPIFTPLIAVTLDISEEKVDSLSFDQPTAIGLTIIVQNLDRLKNSWPLIMSQISAVLRAT